MTLEQLRIFVAVAEREHMTRAAAALGLTQSGVSAAVAALEARYATPLFHRVGRHLELTEAGGLFLGEARGVLARAAAAEQALLELGGLARGRLRIHASQTIAGYWLPRHLVRFRRAHPQIALSLAIGNTAEVAKAIIEGTAELGFVEGAVSQPALLQQPVAGDRLVVVVGRDHPWAGLATLDSGRLAQAEWVLRESGSGTRSEFEAALARHGIAPGDLRVCLELPSNEAVRSAVMAGAGATALSELLVETGLRSGRLCRVPFPLPGRTFLALQHRERYLSRLAGALLALIEDKVGPLAGRA